MPRFWLPILASVQAHVAHWLHFPSSTEGLLFWLNEECWSLKLIPLAELVDLLIERQSQQPDTGAGSLDGGAPAP